MPAIKEISTNKFFIQTPKKDSSEVQAVNTPAISKKNSHKTELIIGGLSGLGIIGLSGVIISQRGIIRNLNRTINNTVSNAAGRLKEELIPYTVLPFENTKLYKNFVSGEESFMKYIEKVKATPAEIKEFLFGITADKRAAGVFIDEVTVDPRKSAKYINILKNKIGGWKNLSEWLQAPNGYQEAYYYHINEKVKDMTIKDMLELSPNWHLYYLLAKSDNNLKFGNLPKQFKELGDYSKFIEWLHTTRNECERGIPFIREYNGKLLEITDLKAGLSGKRPVKVKFLNPEGNPETEKAYVIKIQELWGCEHHNVAKENFAYRADSTFINAQIDYYLNLHRCENTIRFHYFDYDSDSSIYEFIDQKAARAFEIEENSSEINLNNILEVNKLLKDLNLLGIHCNDAHSGNIVKHKGKYRIIDIGDATFIDPLRPGVLGLHFEFPNNCGIAPPNFALALKQ